MCGHEPEKEPICSVDEQWAGHVRTMCLMLQSYQESNGLCANCLGLFLHELSHSILTNVSAVNEARQGQQKLFEDDELDL